MIRRAALAIALLCMAGCQTTSSNVQSFTDPAWNHHPVPSILVEVQNADLRERDAIERAAVTALSEAGIPARASMDIFLPTRTYSAGERRRLARESGMAAVLTVQPTGRQIERSYTPPMRPHAGFGYGWGSRGYRYSGLGVGVDTGLLLEEPIATYHAELAPLSNEKVIWVGDVVTRGPTGMSFSTVGARFADYLVRRLREDGMI